MSEDKISVVQRSSDFSRYSTPVVLFSMLMLGSLFKIKQNFRKRVPYYKEVTEEASFSLKPSTSKLLNF